MIRKNYFDKTLLQKILYNKKIRITRVFLWIKDPDPGDPKRPDPDRNTGCDYISHNQIIHGY